MLKYKKFFSLILIFSSILIIQGNLSPDDISNALYNEGLRKYILKDYKGAVRDFENAHRIDKQDNKIRRMYINALVKQGNSDYDNKNLESARTHYTRALTLADKDSELQRKLKLVNNEINNRRKKEQIRKEQIAKDAAKKKEENKSAEPKVKVDQKKEQIIKKYVRTNIPPPFNIENFIREQNKDNKKILTEIIEAQKKERENLFKNMEAIEKSQREDRKVFSRSLLLLIGGGILIAIIIAILMIVMMKKQAAVIPQLAHEQYPSIDYKPAILLEYTKNIDESKYITDERYSDMVRAKNLQELYSELAKGNLSWDIIQEYIAELNHELKIEILSIVEKKILSGEAMGVDNILQILLPLITDGEEDISRRSRYIIKGITSEELADYEILEEKASPKVSGPLSYTSLMQFASMSDFKTGRLDHSPRVAEITFNIAKRLNDSSINPSVARRVALAHDIGYLEIADNIVKKKGSLTEKEFSTIKTHTTRGLKLLKHTKPPDIFIDGIKYHHERIDGSGYPEGLKGKDIPLIARIIGAADFFEAVTSPRPQRDALSVDSCLEMMKKLSGKHLNKDIVNIISDLYKG